MIHPLGLEKVEVGRIGQCQGIRATAINAKDQNLLLFLRGRRENLTWRDRILFVVTTGKGKEKAEDQ